MENTRYRECLAADFSRLREVAAADPTRPVPTCPGWHVADLIDHVAEVYLHKVESMRRGELPEPWPPERSGEKPLALLDRAYAELVAEFDARPPEQRTAHWYEPDPTVGCLTRRMAQETVIHRIDAELAAGGPVTPIPEDLAVDGVDEMLVVVLGFLSHTWPEAFTDLPADRDAPAVRVRAGDTSWRLTPTPRGVLTTPDGTDGNGDAAGAAAVATVSGEPASVLRWLWGRPAAPAVTATGDPAALARLQGLLREAAQ